MGIVSRVRATAGRPAVSGRVFISLQAQNEVSQDDVFDSHSPPFDLEADMLFVGTWASTRELRGHFPRVPFLAFGSATPLILWFSRVRSLNFGQAGNRQALDEASGFGYNELNVVALTRSRRLFVPVIYASGELSQRLGHRYGMPKKRVSMTFEASDSRVTSEVELASARSEARAAILTSGRLLSRPFEWSAPWWTWPADFPDGSFIRARIQRVPRAQLAKVRGGLELDQPWHAESTRLWPLGVYVPGLRMHLPAPC